MSKALSLSLLSGILYAAVAEAGVAEGPVLPAKITAKMRKQLKAISEAGEGGTRVDITDDTVKVFFAAHWVDKNPKSLEGTTQIVRINAAGQAALDNGTGEVTGQGRGNITSRPNMSRDDYEIERVALPDVLSKLRAPRESYPFEKLTEAGLSFFIPQPAEYTGTDFAASKQGTIGGRNRKAKEEWESLPADQRPARPASYRAINDTKDGVAGARIIRMS